MLPFDLVSDCSIISAADGLAIDNVAQLLESDQYILSVDQKDCANYRMNLDEGGSSSDALKPVAVPNISKRVCAFDVIETTRCP